MQSCRVVLTCAVLMLANIDAYADDLPSTPPRWLTFEALEGTIVDAARKEGLHPGLVRAVIKAGSYYDQFSVSPDGRVGLMWLSKEETQALDDPFDPKANIAAGTRRLKQLIDETGSIRRALLKYRGQGSEQKRFVVDALRHYRNLRIVYLKVR